MVKSSFGKALKQALLVSVAGAGDICRHILGADIHGRARIARISDFRSEMQYINISDSTYSKRK